MRMTQVKIDTKAGGGFTIVELLIVIVVIAILAAISVVAYNGIQMRAKVTRATSDLKNMQKLVELHRADKGLYPISSGGNWSHQNTSTQNSFIPGIVSEYASSLPMADTGGSYVYRSNTAGTEFKIIRYRGGGLEGGERNYAPDSMKDANSDRYGVWSSGGYSL